MLWDDFLNSEWHDWRGSGRSEDRLEQPEWIRQWLDGHGLAGVSLPDPEELAALKGLRSLMQSIVKALSAGEPVSAPLLDDLNRVLAGGPVFRRLMHSGGRYVLELDAQHSTWPSVRAETAASLARTLAEGDPARIRICENRDCLWVYYDDTRNRSKRYCDDKLCGNLMKVRRFRAKKKAQAREQERE
ncbi:CGNR zinc finger domain-containing protein [Paenibacillus sp. S-38]|uniref:CGNR zinc finger domain-containing protein n=1 Tax=Paenibacillus sp. S-38 TaxID=3416710 RepID=UPI003CFB091F